MALFFDPDETMPEPIKEDVESICEQIGKPLCRLVEKVATCREFMEDSPEDFDRAHLIFKDVVDFLNLFFSESEKDRRIVRITFSDNMVDTFFEKYYDTSINNVALTAPDALALVSNLVIYQCRAGGSHLINCLNRTMKVFDRLYELCERICIRYPDRTDNTKELMVKVATMQSVPYMLVGDRKRFAKRKHLHNKRTSKMTERSAHITDFDVLMADEGIRLTDEGMWQIHRKELTYPNYCLACINCGELEKEGKKHNRCGACSNALYCSKECQKLHWKQHKADCRANTASRRKKSTKQRT
mmetsp:Transcript_9433/g.14020  ORF Transcript_9433/g.14020 Transcript_9433/m.14020 type:complete len:300 (+) Transcript_9433:94-993(+)|eukprot:CAMPEP_0196824374 /NCGR_PEP_ID=MMETSP1362-20130617/91589_1 /TAXON_ID=163516 /ORGANISM="Leptocylindrus danicus, Strain CCMP1856" /LENGTH=299 /DNA_ID=CAMNT_0042204611 /DNA_START=79 /DNA_END=978 /DNA_ORIENTATION=+